MPKKGAAKTVTYSISELARELDVAPSTIRFYEKTGLISPMRTAGNQRFYTPRNRARLKLILRGRRLGFALEEIAEMIGMKDGDNTEMEQIVRSLDFGEAKLREIRSRREELDLLERDILAMKEELLKRLDGFKTNGK